MEELNEKQKMFCLEYLKSFNGRQAYLKVYGGTTENADSGASRLLSNPKVSEYLASRVKQKVDKIGVGVDYVLSNLQQIVEIGMGRQAVMKDGKEKEIIDLNNANSALEKLGKYNKMYTDKVEQDTSLNINIVNYNEEGQN